MRIGLITGEYPPMQGGIADFTRALAQALVAQGHTVFILTDQRAQSEGAISVSNSIRRWDWPSLRKTRQWAHENQLDVVDIQFETAAYRMSPFVHLLPVALRGIPTFTTFHDLLVPYLFPKAESLRYRIVLMLARHSTGVIVTNLQDELKLQSENGIKRLTQIPLGSAIPTQPPPNYDRTVWRATHGIASESFLIGYFGFLNASKGVDTLLDGVALAVQQGLNADVLMIGGSAGTSDPENIAYIRQIEAQIERLGLTARVQWTGFANEQQVSGHFLACDVIALPFNDGLSMRRSSFVAALAHGCPIISTTPAVALPELDDCVYLIPPQSPAALTAALIDLHQNPVACQRLAENARRQAGHYSWESIARRTVAFFGDS